MTITNLYDSTTQDYNSYIRFANQILGSPCARVSDTQIVSNRIAWLPVVGGKTYVVKGNFDNRFRIATLNSANMRASYVVTNYVFDSRDNNDSSIVGDNRQLTITAENDHNILLIGYYSSTGTIPFLDIKNSIVVTEYIHEPETFTVTYNTDGGTEIEPVTVTDGGTITEPTAPTKDGYNFSGWYSDSGLTTLYDFNTAVTSDITLYAKWIEIPVTTYTVTFETNGGSSVAPQTITEGDYVVEPSNPTKSGNTFDDWYKEDTFITAWNFETDTVTADITLYAKWVIATPEPITGNIIHRYYGQGIFIKRRK